MSKIVLDASALLAFLNEEPGAERWASAMGGAAISTVNLAEVVGRLADAGVPEVDIRDALEPLGMEVVDFTPAMAYRAGVLRPVTRDTGLSLGDRACLALAQELGVPVLTADRAWEGLRVPVKVRVMR
ncbi:MAG: type II toxin-antitoxin system VapC family toxin [Armatimonadetes bacterium]|nr:type II toxin-antitoxin system VapC family toxin [Armatimonadota bacterium]